MFLCSQSLVHRSQSAWNFIFACARLPGITLFTLEGLEADNGAPKTKPEVQEGSNDLRDLDFLSRGRRLEDPSIYKYLYILYIFPGSQDVLVHVSIPGCLTSRLWVSNVKTKSICFCWCLNSLQR